MREKWIRFWQEEDGLGTLEILLILAVLVAIAIVFRKWIVSWVNSLFTETENEMNNKGGEGLMTPTPTSNQDP